MRWRDALSQCCKFKREKEMGWREEDGPRIKQGTEDKAGDRVELQGFGWFKGPVYRVRREKKKGMGYILVSRARHVRARAGKLDRSDFIKMFEPVQVTSTHFLVSDIFHHFSRNFLHFFTFIQNLQNKIKSNKNLKNMIITSTK